MFLSNKQQMDFYKAHQWTTVEAAYIKSNSYTETDRYNDGDGNVEEVERTRYEWHYEYEIDGQVYECISRGEVSEKPYYEEQNTRTIMVATDDYSVYMLYESEEDFKNSYNSGTKILMIVWGVIWGIIFLGRIFIMVLSKKIKKRAS